MLGFMCACGVGLPARLTSPAAARTSPTMKGKGGRKSRRAPTPAAARKKSPSRSPPGVEPAGKGGFGEGGGGPEAPAAAADSLTEQVSGTLGDSTAHRVFSPGGRAALQNPMKDAAAIEVAASAVDESDGDAAVTAELARIQKIRERAALVSGIEPDEGVRWEWGLSLDKAVERMALAEAEGNLETVVVTNRDMVNFRMLYRFTSAILQAEGDGATEEGANMRDLRKRIIDTCWHFDRPLRDELFDAERRLVEVLRAVPESNAVGEVEAHCGRKELDVNVFWLVTYGAVAAWEVRQQAKTEAQENNQLDVQERILLVSEAMGRSKVVEDHLSPALSVVGEILTATSQEDQVEALAKVDEAMTREMGTLLEQIRLWPQNAYGPFVDKFQAIVDASVEKITGEPVQKIKAFRFPEMEFERGSRLVEFTKRNAAQNR